MLKDFYKKKIVIVLVCFSSMSLSACTSTEDAREQSFIGTKDGQNLYKFRSETAGFFMKRKLDANIRSAAKLRCPSGYKELSRERAGSELQHINGVPITYFYYDVTISCPTAS